MTSFRVSGPLCFWLLLLFDFFFLVSGFVFPVPMAAILFFFQIFLQQVSIKDQKENLDWFILWRYFCSFPC